MRIVKILPYWAFFFAACSSPVANAPQVEGNGAVVYEGARLITGEEFLPIEDSAFVVENGTFTAVGRKGEVDIPAGAARVDLTGKTVMPGLFDLHAHFGYWKGGVTTSADYFTRETILDQLDMFAYAGFSGVLSAGVDRPPPQGDVAYQVRDESPLPGKPIFRTAGQGLASPGGGAGGVLTEGVVRVATEADARKHIQGLAAKKADFVKFWAGIRDPKVPGADAPRAARMAVYRAILDEAHKHNLKAMVDVRELEDIKDLMRAGIDGFAHRVWGVEDPDDELIELFKQRPEVFVLTTFTWSTRTGYRPPILDEPLWRELYPPHERKLVADGLAATGKVVQLGAGASLDYRLLRHSRAKRSVAKLRAAGVRFGLGTDFGGSGLGHGMLGVTGHMELEAMVENGFTPQEAIIAGTRKSAEILGLDNLGMVAVGKSADFIVLDANPLDNIANTRRIAKVYLRGAELDRAALRAKWGRRDTSN